MEVQDLTLIQFIPLESVYPCTSVDILAVDPHGLKADGYNLIFVMPEYKVIPMLPMLDVNPTHYTLGGVNIHVFVNHANLSSWYAIAGLVKLAAAPYLRPRPCCPFHSSLGIGGPRLDWPLVDLANHSRGHDCTLDWGITGRLYLDA